MSLITRCPACGTMFKVVTDQLKVSQGWVRCGQCTEVFDAALHLQPAPGEIARAAVQPAEAGFTDDWSMRAQTEETIPLPLSAMLPQKADAAGLPEVYFAREGTADFDPAGWGRQQSKPPPDDAATLRRNASGKAVRALPDDDDDDADRAGQASSSFLVHPETETGDLPQPMPELHEEVSFVRDAERRAFWHKPYVRRLMGLAALLLVCLLLLQIVIAHKDDVVALEPGFKPALQTLCKVSRCEVGPLRRIEAVVIESSSFNKIDSTTYRLNFAFRNTGTVPVAMPSLEVTLTDAQDQPLVRRVLAPAQLGAPMAALAGGSDFASMLLLQVAGADAPSATSPGAAVPVPVTTGALRIAGYRVLAFYP